MKATFGDGITCEIREQNLSLLFLFLFIALCSRLLLFDFERVNITGVTGVYSCYKGYVMISDTTRRCPNDGTWTGSAPTPADPFVSCAFSFLKLL